MGLEALLLTLITIFAIPAWVTFIWRKCSSRLSLGALILNASSELLQLVFVVGVGMHLFTLGWSTYFGMFGLPLCLAGTIVGMVSRWKTGSGVGYIVTGAFTFVCWMFLLTVH